MALPLVMTTFFYAFIVVVFSQHTRYKNSWMIQPAISYLPSHFSIFYNDFSARIIRRLLNVMFGFLINSIPNDSI